jgi:ubiquinone/menaquinone biosynthesis C-methylase UbiE
MDLHGKHVIDIGCGTGRHWKTILSQKPVRLQGFDVSANMLKALKQKFPTAETFHTNNELLVNVESDSVDVIISTLTIAHVSDINTMFHAWKRVLKPGGEILLTDFHPVVLANGGKRDFQANGNKIEIENRVHTIEEIIKVAASLELELIAFQERMIDETVKHFYESQNALNVYDRYQGQPIIYGMHLRN